MFVRSKYLILCLLVLTMGSCKPILYSIFIKKDVSKDVFVYENEDGKRVVYIGMTHLGKDGYYKSVKTRVDSLRAEGYLVFYESVDSSSNDTILRKFKKVTGVYLTDYKDVDNKSMNLPKDLSKYEAQANNLGLNYSKDIHADYSLDSLVYVYEKEYQPIVLTDCDWETPLKAKYKCKDTVKHSRFTMVYTLREKKIARLVKEHKDQDILIVYGYGHRFWIDGDLRDLDYKLIEGKLRAF